MPDLTLENIDLKRAMVLAEPEKYGLKYCPLCRGFLTWAIMRGFTSCPMCKDEGVVTKEEKDGINK